MFGGIPESGGESEGVLVVNPLSKRERRIVSVEMTGKYGCGGFDVYEGDRRLPCQSICDRKHGDGSFNAGTLLFEAELPALGAKTFRVIPKTEAQPNEGTVKVSIKDQSLILQNECFRAEMNLKRGGVICSLMDAASGAELVPEGADFNEYKGYFIEEGRFCSNSEFAAEAEIAYQGALEAVVILRGRIANAAYEQRITIQAACPRLDVQVRFDFGEATYIGEPYQMEREYEDEAGRHFDSHRTYHDGRYRLNAYFPTAFDQIHIDKDCAYDVCRSALDDTHFKTWNEIKHNILLHWVDATDGERGLCVLCDHTTAYEKGKDAPLGLALAWGYDAGFWWGRRPLSGIHALRYQIMPHEGDWRTAGLWHECEQFLHRPIARRSAASLQDICESALEVCAEGVELGSLYRQNGLLYARIFNAGEEKEAKITIDATRFAGIMETAPDGMPAGSIHEMSLESGRAVYHITLPRFGIRTYRLLEKP